MGSSTMARKKVPRLTRAERAILGVLWQRGPTTARDIHEALSQRRASGYTTILKLLSIMIVKKLVARDDSQRAHVYRALIAESDMERSVIQEILTDMFGGSGIRLAMRALSEEISDPAELELLSKRANDAKRKGK